MPIAVGRSADSGCPVLTRHLEPGSLANSYTSCSRHGIATACVVRKIYAGTVRPLPAVSMAKVTQNAQVRSYVTWFTIAHMCLLAIVVPVCSWCHLPGPGPVHAAADAQHLRAGGLHREHHAKLVLWQHQEHAHPQRPVQGGWCSDAAVQQADRVMVSCTPSAAVCRQASTYWYVAGMPLASTACLPARWPPA